MGVAPIGHKQLLSAGARKTVSCAIRVKPDIDALPVACVAVFMTARARGGFEPSWKVHVLRRERLQRGLILRVLSLHQAWPQKKPPFVHRSAMVGAGTQRLWENCFLFGRPIGLSARTSRLRNILSRKSRLELKIQRPFRRIITRHIGSIGKPKSRYLTLVEKITLQGEA